MPISCNFRDCKMLLATSLTHAASAISMIKYWTLFDLYFVTPYLLVTVVCVNWQDYVHEMPVDEIREYMEALLTAVAHVHSCRIIHRDIKHSNFLYNRRLRQFSFTFLLPFCSPSN